MVLASTSLGRLTWERRSTTTNGCHSFLLFSLLGRHRWSKDNGELVGGNIPIHTGDFLAPRLFLTLFRALIAALRHQC